ncbi:MAG: phage portal protein [Acidimicrobiia bacterium]
MASLLSGVLRPRNEGKPPIPYTGRRSSMFGGNSGPSASNTLDRMGQVGTLFAIVNRTSTAAAAVDWHLYRKPADGRPDPDADRETVAVHAAAALWANPNPFYTQADLVETVQQHVDLAGEGFLVVVRRGGIPIELWPVRPDRMTPHTDPTKYLVGWWYRGPDGEKIPLGHDEVIQLRMPNPTDPFRGLAPMSALLAELDSAQAATEWSRNFFSNSAQPGGVIEFPEGLTDEDFDQAREHWAEQHQGVRNAHRVAIIEHGTWKTTSFSPKDLDFSALRNLSRDAIMEGYGISRATLGMTDGVNYAAARAARAQFAELLTVPRLERWKQALNHRLLPMFGATSKGVEFDYESPAESDPDVENAERTSRVGAVVQLLSIPTVKFDPAATLEAFGLPDLPFEEVEPPAPVAPVAPPPPPGQPVEPEPDEEPEARATPRVQAAVCDHEPVRNADDPDMSALQQAWERAVEALLRLWEDVKAAWRAALRKQVTDAIDDDDFARLAAMTVDWEHGAEILAEAMEAIARVGARHVAQEAAAQGVDISTVTPDPAVTRQTADTVAALLAAAHSLGAGQEAVRVHVPGETGAQTATKVDQHLREMSDRPQRDALGGALTGAQNAGMRSTYAGAADTDGGLPGPVGSIYATEVMDSGTCAPCRAIDGRFICTTEDMGPYDRLYTAMGGYVDCLGGVRCRGSVTGVWRPRTVEEDS